MLQNELRRFISEISHTEIVVDTQRIKQKFIARMHSLSHTHRHMNGKPQQPMLQPAPQEQYDFYNSYRHYFCVKTFFCTTALTHIHHLKVQMTKSGKMQRMTLCHMPITSSDHTATIYQQLQCECLSTQCINWNNPLTADIQKAILKCG